MDSYGTISRLHDLLDHSQTESQALTINLGRPLQLPKASEELGEFIRCDARTRILDIENQHAFLIASPDWDLSVESGEFDRIFDQVHEHLLQTSAISN